MTRNVYRKIFLAALFCGLIFLLGSDAFANILARERAMPNEIVFAGGCFWGVQEYFSRVPGVEEVTSGYAQSNVADPTYRQVCSGDTGAAEAVLIKYDPSKAPLQKLVARLFRIIDPFALNRQGNDIGTQYRSGIFYLSADQLPAIEKAITDEAAKYNRPFAVVVEPLRNFYPAEEYHQDYLRKNPGGYCHISFDSLNDPELAGPAWQKPPLEKLRQELSPEAWHVTQENGTEPPFSGKFWKFDEPGIYVDVASGQPLFLSTDKFPSSCGWPAFSTPVQRDALVERQDNSHNMSRTEVRSSGADSHLGHVFADGPRARGGLRYCINSAALRFISLADMEKEGYGEFVQRIKNQGQ